MLALIKTSIGTKFVIRWADLMCCLALEAVRTVSQGDDAVGSAGGGVRTVDIKRYARVEKVPGGEVEDSRVLSGVMLNKDIVHPQMRRRIHEPRIVLLDCPLEYKKGESQTNIEISKEADFARINQIEEGCSTSKRWATSENIPSLSTSPPLTSALPHYHHS